MAGIAARYCGSFTMQGRYATRPRVVVSPAKYSPSTKATSRRPPAWGFSRPSSARGACRLYIRGLAADATDRTLRRLFQGYGPVVSATAVRQGGRAQALDPRLMCLAVRLGDGLGGRCLGIGFVKFASPRDAAKAAAETHEKAGQADP